VPAGPRLELRAACGGRADGSTGPGLLRLTRRLRAVDHRPVPRPQRIGESIPWVSTTTPSFVGDRPSGPEEMKEQQGVVGSSLGERASPSASTRGASHEHVQGPRDQRSINPYASLLLFPRVRKDGRHRDLARSDRDPADRFPSELTAGREGVLAGALRAGKRDSAYPYSGEAPASAPFRPAGLCVGDSRRGAAGTEAGATEFRPFRRPIPRPALSPGAVDPSSRPPPRTHRGIDPLGPHYNAKLRW
jgi:hypothetical protein